MELREIDNEFDEENRELQRTLETFHMKRDRYAQFLNENGSVLRSLENKSCKNERE